MARRTDALVALGLGVAAFATRWTVRGHSLLSYDSGLLASGIEEFDFDHEWPHPPFYALTVGAGKLLALAMRPAEALVLLSILSSVVLVVATYAVALAVGGRLVAVGAALLVLLSPTALFNGAVALSYASEGAASAVIAWAAWRARQSPSARSGVLVGLALALAAGLRPSTLLFLGPLAAWGVGRTKASAAAAFGALAVGGLAWGVPMLVAGGGLRDFLTYNSYQSEYVILSWTVMEGGTAAVRDHLGHLASYVARELPFVGAVAVLAVAGALLLRREAAPAAKPTATPAIPSFLAMWLLPALLFYIFVYAGWPVHPSGYSMVLVPAGALACALVLARLARAVRRSGAPAPAQAVALAIVVAVATMPVGWATSWDAAMEPQRAADRFHDDWRGVESRFPPNETALLTFIQWHWVLNEHPDYLVWGAHPYWNDSGLVLVQVAEGRHGRVDRPTASDILDGPFEEPHPVPAGIRRVLLVDDGTGPEMLKPGIEVHAETLASGKIVYGFDPAQCPTIEACLRWFDEAGRLDLTTLRQEDPSG